jgi:hypothetical protein
MSAWATGPGTLKVANDRFPNFVLKRELLGPAAFRSSNDDCFVSPINIVELQVCDLGGPHAIDGT